MNQETFIIEGESLLEIVLLTHSFKIEYYFIVSKPQNFFLAKIAKSLVLEGEGEETLKDEDL